MMVNTNIKMQNAVKRVLITALILSGLMSACTKMNATYKHFIEGGEIRYSKQLDSIKIFPGYNRIKFSWLIISDPHIDRVKIYWDNGADSIEVPMKGTSEIDSASVVIGGLEEGRHEFTIYTIDDVGHPSTPLDTMGYVYGDEFISSLSNRIVDKAVLVNGKPKINWLGEPDTTAIGVEIRYKNQNNTVREVFVPSEEMVTRINDEPLGDTLQYRTLFLPDSTAIDTFYTPYSTLKLEEAVPKELDKSKFSLYPLPGDLTNRYNFKGLWDGNTNKHGGLNSATHQGLPQHFQIDLGAKVKLTAIKVWQMHDGGRSYKSHNIRKFELWGSNDPNPDGSFDDWTKLQTCEIVKPSGLPYGQVTQEDKEAAAEGHKFLIPKSAPAVRYVRFNILDVWKRAGGQTNVWMIEVSFWGIAE